MKFLKEVAIEVRNILLVLIAPGLVALCCLGCVPEKQPAPDIEVKVLKVYPLSSGLLVTMESTSPVRRFSTSIGTSSQEDIVVPEEGEKWIVKRSDTTLSNYKFVRPVK